MKRPRLGDFLLAAFGLIAACSGGSANEEIPTATNSSAEAGSSSAGPAPLDFDLNAIYEEQSSCVLERTGISEPRHAGGGEQLPDEYLIAGACRLEDNTAQTKAPPPDIIIENIMDAQMPSTASCLVAKYGWAISDDLLQGVAGAVAPPDLSADSKREQLSSCGWDVDEPTGPESG